MELKDGMTPYSDGTFDCDEYTGCQYNIDGRCIFRVARLQIEYGRACHEDVVQNEVEAYLDYMDQQIYERIKS